MLKKRIAQFSKEPPAGVVLPRTSYAGTGQARMQEVAHA